MTVATPKAKSGKAAEAKVKSGQYRHDGEKLWRVLDVTDEFTWLEDCAEPIPSKRGEPMPTEQVTTAEAEAMTLVKAGPGG